MLYVVGCIPALQSKNLGHFFAGPLSYINHLLSDVGGTKNMTITQETETSHKKSQTSSFIDHFRIISESNFYLVSVRRMIFTQLKSHNPQVTTSTPSLPMDHRSPMDPRPTLKKLRRLRTSRRSTSKMPRRTHRFALGMEKPW